MFRQIKDALILFFVGREQFEDILQSRQEIDIEDIRLELSEAVTEGEDKRMPNCQTCPTCGVKIICTPKREKDSVIYSYNPNKPYSRKHLHDRICIHVRNKPCINQ